jgi:hypothetical protein
VRTTGATLLSAASSLEQHGHSVCTLTLAWSPEDDGQGRLRAHPAANV